MIILIVIVCFIIVGSRNSELQGTCHWVDNFPTGKLEKQDGRVYLVVASIVSPYLHLTAYLMIACV